MCSGCGFPCGGACGCDSPLESETTISVTYNCKCGNVFVVSEETVSTYGRSWYAETECQKCKELVSAEGELEEDIDDWDYGD